MNVLHTPPTFAQQSAKIAYKTFFALVQAALLSLLLIVAVLIVGQSTVAPVSVRLLTTYAMEYAVTYFKPYRGYFPQPYTVDLKKK